MTGISNKDHVNAGGKFDADEQRGIEALAAQAVAYQPEAARAGTARKLGNFLKTRKEMRGEADSIGRSILEQAGHMRDNPWVTRIDKGMQDSPVR